MLEHETVEARRHGVATGGRGALGEVTTLGRDLDGAELAAAQGTQLVLGGGCRGGGRLDGAVLGQGGLDVGGALLGVEQRAQAAVDGLDVGVALGPGSLVLSGEVAGLGGGGVGDRTDLVPRAQTRLVQALHLVVHVTPSDSGRCASAHRQWLGLLWSADGVARGSAGRRVTTAPPGRCLTVGRRVARGLGCGFLDRDLGKVSGDEV